MCISLIISVILSFVIVSRGGVAVLEEGRVIEQGTHDEFPALKKRYKFFYDIQFSTEG